MIYILTTLAFILGVGFHIMQKIRSLRTKFPEFTPRKIMGTFALEEWDTLIASFLCWLLLQLGIFIIIYNKVHLPAYVMNWLIYPIAIVVGYAGQRLAYKYLGTAEEVLNDKADKIRNL